jgi:eukaryotic-like serine/threonine-protein kinase
MDTARPDGGDAFRARFEIREKIGSGGMADVYLAHDTFSQRDVAIKMARLKLLEDPEVGARAKKLWLNETRLAGRLRHPCIVQLYEAGVTDDFGYLVMEYVRGGTLKPYTRPDKLLEVNAVVEIVYKVCNALDYANRQGLLHRDIKPANVMLSDGGAVKVTDFGTCYVTDSDETQVFDVGTMPYMPPEHFRKRNPTIQSDIYAVGVMTYQLLAGSLPFDAGSFQEMIYQKLQDKFVPLETRRSDIPPGLRFVVHRALHPDPETRYASWENLCDDLALAMPQVNRTREIASESARFDMLRRLSFFAEFSDAELWETIRISNWSERAANDVVCEEGASGNTLYVIARGDAVVLRDGVLLNRLGPGECFGEIGYLDETRHARSATVRTRTKMILMEVDAEVLRRAAATLQAVFTRAVVRLILRRLNTADRRFLDVLGGRADVS